MRIGGTIEAGRLADLVAVDGDVAATPERLEQRDNVRLVMKDGRVVRSWGGAA